MKIKNHLLGMMAIASLLARRNSHPKFQTSVDVGLYDSVGKKVVSFLSWYYEKMKTSISARKLFTLILVMVLLAVQYVDYETTLSAVRANHLIGEASSFLKMDKAGMGSWLWNTCLNQKKIIFSLSAAVSVTLILIDGRLLIGSECIGRRSYFSKVRRTWTGWF